VHILKTKAADSSETLAFVYQIAQHHISDNLPVHITRLKFLECEELRKDFHNGRYIDCLSLTYATNKSKMLKLQYRY